MNYKEWADRYLCKWHIKPEDTYNDIINAIKHDKPLSFTRFGDGEIFLLKEYFNKIKNKPEHITMCNADLLVEPVSWINPPYNTLNFYTERYHNILVNNFINKYNLTDESTVKTHIDLIGKDVILALQNSSHIGIWNTDEMLINTTIDDFYLYKHSYIPHIQLFADIEVDFKKLTDVNVYRNDTFLNPHLFKNILNGKPVHIITSNEHELKNIIKIHKILNVDVTYTNLTPNDSDLNTLPWTNHDYLYDKCSQIKEQIVLFGLGYGAKHIPSYLMKNYNKTVIDLGSVLDLWACKNTRPWMKNNLDKNVTKIKHNEKEITDFAKNKILNKPITQSYASLSDVIPYYKEWANRALCKWNVSQKDGLYDVIYAIQNNLPLSYTRFCDGELMMLKEYFSIIKNDSYYISLCNANNHIPAIKEYYYLSNNIEQYANMIHNRTINENYIKGRWGIYDEITKKKVIKLIGKNILYGLQNSSHIGIYEFSNSQIDDYYLIDHTYTPHIELFAACKVDFSKLTSPFIHTEESLANPYKFKEILNGKPIHIFTSNEEELKNVTKLHEILEVDITYTNIKPVKGQWKTHSFVYNEYLQEVSKSIKENIVLYGLGYGAKHLPSYLEKTYGKTVIDMGAVLDAWSGKISRPWMKNKEYMLPVSSNKVIESYPWDHSKPTY